MIQLFPLHIVVFIEYKKTYQKGILDHWGERCSILDLLFWERGVAIFKLSYNYMKMISLQNVMEKIINDIITLYLFNILKLLCFYFCTFILFSYINVCIEWFGESHLRATVCKFVLDLTFFYFSSYLCFHVLGKVLVKSLGRFGVLKYITFNLLTHI